MQAGKTCPNKRLMAQRPRFICLFTAGINEGMQMRSIVRLGNSSPNISVKKGLTLLFVRALLLAGTVVAGCTSSTNQTESSSGNGGASGISDSGGMKIPQARVKRNRSVQISRQIRGKNSCGTT